jgi:hypothetical protein
VPESRLDDINDIAAVMREEAERNEGEEKRVDPGGMAGYWLCLPTRVCVS